ncbi:MAG: NFACT family protein [Clostridia bacterium]|nr:NFACT family protein [Clostridia bacterium]
MAFDGILLNLILKELNEAIGSHIDKIYQPSKDELVFLLRKKGFAKRLLITIKQGSARLHFTENKYENPAVPPNFCMLLRKYLSSAKLESVTQPDFERVAELNFFATNEMGDSIKLKLICELISGSANVILVNFDGKIIDSLRHSDVETSKRYILPNAIYEYPESLKKKNPLKCDFKALAEETRLKNIDISKFLLSQLDGLSPLICREAEYLFKKDLSLDHALNKIKGFISEKPIPNIIYKPDGSTLDYCFMPIKQYGENYKNEEFENFSLMLDSFYTSRDTQSRIKAYAHDIIRLITNLKNRTEKKLALRLEELEKCKDRELLRIYGELLKANLYNIKNGSKKAVVQNYYDEDLKLIEIPLNPALSPSKNAEKYFKDYKKTYTAEQTLTALTEQDRKELLYFDSVLDSISRCSTISELEEIKQELSGAGYIKSAGNKKVKLISNSFKEYESIEGFKILVGKNNTQNDYITTKLASKNDLWFHTKNIPGSHVVIFCCGEDISDETILFAAKLAAQNSKAAASAQVPVDYTLIKNVKKPSGAKLGMVIYTTNKTIYVNP